MSDMTRTIFVGKPSKREEDLYEKVLKSKQAGEGFVVAGGKAAFADLAARQALGPLNRYFIHTLGHGVGTRIHEAPRIYWRRTRPCFRVGMVVTVEPGIYIPGKLGIRIEDTGVVTEKGFQKLTRAPLTLVSVPVAK
jgi:Xaa-Pro aminopeptidase